jgi:toxin-antitoxin system PIN domain toxin
VVSPYLLDVNALIALVLEDHVAHKTVKRWFQQTGSKSWVTCPWTEASFVRIVSNPRFSEPALDISEAMEMLDIVTRLPGHGFWALDVAFTDAVAPFTDRLFGHQQVSDAYLLGLSLKKKGLLVTLDRAIPALAGSEFRANVVVLE